MEVVCAIFCKHQTSGTYVNMYACDRTHQMEKTAYSRDELSYMNLGL